MISELFSNLNASVTSHSWHCNAHLQPSELPAALAADASPDHSLVPAPNLNFSTVTFGWQMSMPLSKIFLKSLFTFWNLTVGDMLLWFMNNYMSISEVLIFFSFSLHFSFFITPCSKGWLRHWWRQTSLSEHAWHTDDVILIDIGWNKPENQVCPGTQRGCVRKRERAVRKVSVGLAGHDTCPQDSAVCESTEPVDALMVTNRDAFLPKRALLCSTFLPDSWLNCLKTWELGNFSPVPFPFPQSHLSCSYSLYLFTLKTLATITKLLNFFFLYLNNLWCAGYFLL